MRRMEKNRASPAVRCEPNPLTKKNTMHTDDNIPSAAGKRTDPTVLGLPSLLAACFFTFSTLAASADKISLTGTATPTEISGFAGTPFTLGVPEGTRGVNGLWSTERGDKPCHIASMTEDINDSSDDSGALKDLCGKNPTSKEIKAQFDDTKFPKRTFMRALRVCMNNDNTRVKGFQIRGRTIDDGGKVSDLPPRYPDSAGAAGLSALVDLNAPYDQRPNCNGWKKWVECSDGQIATALIAHFEAGSPPRSLTGIALQCRAVGQQ